MASKGGCECDISISLWSSLLPELVCRRAVLFVVPAVTGVFVLDRALPADSISSSSDRRVALAGYDPVAYFKDGRATKGSPEFSAGFDDAIYWFVSAEHRDVFAADPEHYAPQYGGFCAISLANGAIVDPDPEAWIISDGKLYVFGAKQGIPLFEQGKAGIVDKATENWPRLRKQP
jgi:hypothetical protein